MTTNQPTNTNGTSAGTRPPRSNHRPRSLKPGGAALLVGAALCVTAVIAFATEFKDIRGDAAGTVSVIPTANDPSVFNIHFAGTGTLTHIGPFEFVLDCLAAVDGAGKPSPVPGTTGTVTTSNGDQIFFTVRWNATRDGDQIHATGNVTAQAGTGKFAQATVSGEFITEADLGTGQMSLTFNGSITHVALVRAGAGVDGPAIQSTVDQFRADLGPRREISWDGVPDDFAAPNFLPGDFFNSRGAFYSTPGAGVQVSADSSNPTGTAALFGNINPTYSYTFKTFSAERLFSPIGSAIVDLTFFVPGTNIPALVNGFGAVYADADVPDATSFDYFDVLGNSLGTFTIPASNNGLSFLGVSFDSPVVRRVRIVYGNSALGPNDGTGTDVAVMDDFIYGEPQPILETSIRVSQVEVCWSSTPNVTYQVQYRSELTTNLWTSLVDCVRSTGSKSCISDPVIAGQPEKFYRVVQTNCVPAP